MAVIELHDPVMVFDRSDGRKVREYPGKVVKVGRSLATIRYGEAEPYLREAKFRMDTGIIADSYGGVWFQAPEQAAAEKRAETAIRVLRDAGFEVRLGHHPSAALLEALAGVVETFGQEG